MNKFNQNFTMSAIGIGHINEGLQALAEKQPYAINILLNSVIDIVDTAAGDFGKNSPGFMERVHANSSLDLTLDKIGRTSIINKNALPLIRKFAEALNASNPLVSVNIPDDLKFGCDLEDVSLAGATPVFNINPYSLRPDQHAKLIEGFEGEEKRIFDAFTTGCGIWKNRQGELVVLAESNTLRPATYNTAQFISKPILASINNLIDAMVLDGEPNLLVLRIGIDEIINAYQGISRTLSNILVRNIDFRTMTFRMAKPEQCEGVGYTGCVISQTTDETIEMLITVMDSGFTSHGANFSAMASQENPA